MSAAVESASGVFPGAFSCLLTYAAGMYDHARVGQQRAAIQEATQMVMTTIPTNGRTPKLVEQTYCWCGCGESPGNIDSDFKHGHDVKAATAAILIDFGSIKNFLEELGYGPNKRDASLTKTYHEYMASTIEAKARSRRPSWMARR